MAALHQKDRRMAPFKFQDDVKFDDLLPFETLRLMELGCSAQIPQLVFAKPQQINMWLTETHKQRMLGPLSGSR